LTESEIIDQIGRLKSSAKNLIDGDDISVFRTRSKTYAASDSLIEGVHYLPGWLTPTQIAYKLFARNWSDFSAKGIFPEKALLNLNLTQFSAQRKFISPFLRELDRLLAYYSITLVGGDTARAKGDVFTLTFMGSKGRFIARKNASIRMGDLVMQLGSVGGSSYAVERNMNVPPALKKYFATPHIRAPIQHPALKASIDQSDSVHKSLRTLAAMNKLKIAVNLEEVETSHAAVHPTHVPYAAEDLAVFAIASPNYRGAFRVIGKVESIRVRHPGVSYTLAGEGISIAVDAYEHFTSRPNDRSAPTANSAKHR